MASLSGELMTQKVAERFIFGALIFTFGLFLSHCASGPATRRVWLDSSTHKDSPPSWVEENRLTWEKGDKVFFRSVHTVRGDERVNGCYDLAKLDARETLLTEMATDIRGSLDNAQQSLNENAEIVLGKVRSGEFKGRISGMKHTEQYFERYRIGTDERVDCHVLSEITQKDYDDLKKRVVSNIQQADPRLKEAITQKQIEFFENRVPAGQDKAHE